MITTKMERLRDAERRLTVRGDVVAVQQIREEMGSEISRRQRFLCLQAVPEVCARARNASAPHATLPA